MMRPASVLISRHLYGARHGALMADVCKFGGPRLKECEPYISA